MNLPDGIKEWKQSEITRMLVKKLESDRLDSMEATLSVSKDERDKSVGVTLGITSALNLILNLEEGDLSEFIKG